MSEDGQTTNETAEVEDAGTANDSSVESQNQQSQTTSDSDSTPDQEFGETSSEQESLTSESAASGMDLLKEINQDLLELLAKQVTGNQALDEIQKDIKEFKEHNLLETKSVIHPLIQFYDTFVVLEPLLDNILADIKKAFERLGSQLEATKETVEPPGSQLDTISEQLESVKTLLDSTKEQMGKGRAYFNRSKSAKQLVESVEKLVESLETLKTSPSQTDTEMNDESAQSQEETEDRSSLLVQANTEIANELSRFRRNLENARWEFEDVLERIDDVTPYEAAPLDKFDRKEHRAVDTRSTDDPDKDLKVAESHQVGFHRGSEDAQTVFRAAVVTIYRHTPPPDESEGMGDQESTGVDASEGATHGNLTNEPVNGKSINGKGDETNE